MATTRPMLDAPILLTLLLTVSIIRHLLIGAADHRRAATNGNSAPPPMLLPLYHSSPNASLQRRDASGMSEKRRLQIAASRKDSARMRLYDNLLTDGYYTTRLWIGTPPQEFALIVDTGSTVTYVPCSNCKECGKHQDPKFQPDKSNTYEPVKCDLNCNCDMEGKYCIYDRRYAEMSSSSGVLGEDLISFGNESQLVPQRLVFGCENVETGDLYTQRADGIVGLGRGQLSIVDQLVEKSAISDSFSLCYGGMGTTGGAMILGKIPPPPNMAFTRSDPYRSPYYNIDLKEMHVAGKPLRISPKIFDGKYGTVLDSGTTYAYLPEDAFIAFKNAIMKERPNLKQINGPDSNFNDICFSGAGSNVSELSKTFPEVSLVFGNGQKVLLSPENYLFRHTKVRGAYCLGIFQNGNDPTTLLGGIVVRNTLVTYDRESEKIGFWKTNCSNLWKTLNISTAAAPAPEPAPTATPASPTVSALPPTVSSSTGKDVSLPPEPATSGSPQTRLPGELRIGFITFDMLFSTNNSGSKLNLSELSEAIAHELNVDNSQVRLLNFTSVENSSSVQWAIYPAEPASYFPTATATTIILRLTARQLHLPNSYRNYQVVDWKIQPRTKRNWWGQHMLAIIVGLMIIT
uniref:Peptidase A1 domain-containing protein n=1 Tax=Kalanchoe fedtschenkoi TaxID=63787 RepID=A0A7N0SXK8_KALFE